MRRALPLLLLLVVGCKSKEQQAMEEFSESPAGIRAKWQADQWMDSISAEKMRVAADSSELKNCRHVKRFNVSETDLMVSTSPFGNRQFKLLRMAREAGGNAAVLTPLYEGRVTQVDAYRCAER